VLLVLVPLVPDDVVAAAVLLLVLLESVELEVPAVLLSDVVVELAEVVELPPGIRSRPWPTLISMWPISR
jgi:hypothetical protein